MPQVAWVAARDCVGCTLCIDACPFDAIAGIAQRLHRVLPTLCTECGLCLPACPVDCISLRTDPQHPKRDHAYRTQARDRARTRLRRLARQHAEHDQQLQEAHTEFGKGSESTRQAAIAAAIERARTTPSRQ